METRIRITSMRPGEKMIVVAIEGIAKDLLGHLLDLGLSPGTEVEMIRRAPLRGPVWIELRSYQLAIRYDIANAICGERLV